MTQKKAAASGGGMRGFYALLGIVAIAGIGALGYSVMGKSAKAATEPVNVAGLEDPRALFQKAEGVAVGDPSAPVKLIVFIDYMCPGCGQFSLQIQPLLLANEVKAGKLQLVSYDFPLGGAHKHSFLAARAARCAGDQGKFWEYHDLLYGQQSAWSYKPSAPVKDFVGYAAQLGMEQGAFESCLNSDKYADVVTANKMLGEQLGVNATPTVIINNRRVSNPFDYKELSAIIAEETPN
jgi:protein-disulfide isomerase